MDAQNKIRDMLHLGEPSSGNTAKPTMLVPPFGLFSDCLAIAEKLSTADMSLESTNYALLRSEHDPLSPPSITQAPCTKKTDQPDLAASVPLHNEFLTELVDRGHQNGPNPLTEEVSSLDKTLMNKAISNQSTLGSSDIAITQPIGDTGEYGNHYVTEVVGSCGTLSTEVIEELGAGSYADNGRMSIDVNLDIDLAIHTAVNIAVAGGAASTYQTSTMCYLESEAVLRGNFSGLDTFMDFDALALSDLNLFGDDTDGFSSTNSGGNAVVGGLLAINAGNPAITNVVAVNLAPITQSDVGPNSNTITDPNRGTTIEPDLSGQTVTRDAIVPKTNFGALAQSYFNFSDHDANALSSTNSGGNAVIGGLLAINAGNPAISTAVAVNFAPITESSATSDLDGAEFSFDGAEINGIAHPS